MKPRSTKTVVKKVARGRPAVYATEAEREAAARAAAAKRQAAYRAKKTAAMVEGGPEGKQMAVLLPADVAEALDAYMRRHKADGDGMTISEVVVKLLRTQLLRKR